jgi:hypothetical protein
MLICFDASAEAKNALDSILETGHFRDISEAVSMALVNYNVLHQTVTKAGQVFPAATTSPAAGLPEPNLAGSSRPASQTTAERTNTSEPPQSPAIPETFALKATTAEGITLLQPPPTSGPGASNLPPAQWLFGQFNKFLAPKATCRALLNLLQANPGGMPVTEASNKISYAACRLGDYLKALDGRLQLRREDAFSAAFPSTAIEGGGESRLRFGNQFVGNIRQEQLAGFPAALRLVAIDTAKEPRLSLTKAGADFALLENPVLDARGTPPASKLSQQEIAFLLAHILSSVPEETSAYAAILDAIQSGANTPDAVDKCLRERFSLLTDQAITKTFLTTQRTGAISRLVDLGLLAREKEGLRVTYIITQPGKDFRAQVKS